MLYIFPGISQWGAKDSAGSARLCVWLMYWEKYCCRFIIFLFVVSFQVSSCFHGNGESVGRVVVSGGYVAQMMFHIWIEKGNG